MIVAAARLTLIIPENDSLKGKRKVVKSLIEKSRHRFNVAVAEVEDQDVHQRATLGIAVIGSDGRILNSVLDRIVDFMDSLNLADLIGHEIELIPLGSQGMG